MKFMKNFLLAVIIFLLALGCGVNPSPKTDSRKEIGENYAVVIIDGCEYIEFDYGVLQNRVYSLTHKGNCKNPIHVYNK